MKYFYRINEDKTISVGSGILIPNGFTEYIKGSEPKELLDALIEQELINRPNEINSAIQNHLDTKAQEFKYDNMMSARSYAGYTNPFQNEAQALATWCADCWTTAATIQADVEAGNRAMPTVDEVLDELPVYVGA